MYMQTETARQWEGQGEEEKGGHKGQPKAGAESESTSTVVYIHIRSALTYDVTYAHFVGIKEGCEATGVWYSKLSIQTTDRNRL